MGKRSNFERIPRDYYPTPREAVLPLIPHLEFGTMFVEPCAGDGALVRHLEHFGMSCQRAYDIEPRADFITQTDALELDRDQCGGTSAECIITNPPWDRTLLHPMIEAFSFAQPAWLLFDADWMHTKQTALAKRHGVKTVPELMKYCRKIVSVGRVKWIPGSKMTGKDNCAWYLFDQQSQGDAVFHGRAA